MDIPVKSINTALSLLVAHKKFTPRQLEVEVKRLTGTRGDALPEIIEHCAVLVMLGVLKSDISWNRTKGDTLLGFQNENEVRLAAIKLRPAKKKIHKWT